MKVSDFDFELPPELIANYPSKERTGSRLLVVDGPDGTISDKQFSDVYDLVSKNDLLVFNNTKVVPARLFGRKESGGKLEILFERRIDTHTFTAHVRSSRSPKPGQHVFVEGASGQAEVQLEMIERQDALFVLRCHAMEVFELLEAYGHIPLPPYIERADEEADSDRYQTVYADKPGAAAAPTAGLHFDEPLIQSLKAKGAKVAYVTLHVGAGTFQPVKVDKIEDHTMHSEWIEVKQEVVDMVEATRQSGGRVICVGTTSVRSLESASQSGKLEAFTGDTDIFIYPGYSFKSVDALITNFHLPKSTLLMLVSAFSGTENMLKAYQHAVAESYRFFSYGDAMFLNPKMPREAGTSDSQ